MKLSIVSYLAAARIETLLSLVNSIVHNGNLAGRHVADPDLTSDAESRALGAESAASEDTVSASTGSEDIVSESTASDGEDAGPYGEDTAFDSDITTLLNDWNEGDQSALEQLMPLVFGELRRVARGYFVDERPGHTLQPTALVNEVFLRLVDRRKVSWENRSHFFGFAAQLMRRILVDRARSRRADKRGGGAALAPLDEALAVAEIRHLDVVALDEALNALAEIDPEGSRVVEMRFFAGLTHEEIADVLKVPTSRVRRQWTTAKLWLHRQLKR